MADADKILGISVGDINKIMGVDIADITSFVGLSVESGIQGDADQKPVSLHSP